MTRTHWSGLTRSGVRASRVDLLEGRVDSSRRGRIRSKCATQPQLRSNQCVTCRGLHHFFEKDNCKEITLCIILKFECSHCRKKRIGVPKRTSLVSPFIVHAEQHLNWLGLHYREHITLTDNTAMWIHWCDNWMVRNVKRTTEGVIPWRCRSVRGSINLAIQMIYHQ